MNIRTCFKCNRKLIQEESGDHQCKPLVKYEIKQDILWVNDGTDWYPLKLKSTEKLQDKINRRDDSTLIGMLLL